MRARVILIGAAALGLVAGAGGPAIGFFSAQTQTTGVFVAAADWTGPTATPVIQKAEGGSTGFLRAGGGYRAYANITDSGNPASGVASASADLSALSAGQSAVALTTTGGPFTVAGASQAYRSGAVSVDAGAAAGTKAYSVASTDGAGNASAQSGFTVTIDNVAPGGSDVQTANASGGMAGRADAGDTITYTFSEPIDPHSILSDWDGTATDVVARITDGVLGTDSLSVRNAANTAILPLSGGSHVALGSTGYVGTTVDFGATGTRSRMLMSGSAVTVTLGTPSAATTTALLAGAMTWTPAAAAFDRAGNPSGTALVTESGASDVEF